VGQRSRRLTKISGQPAETCCPFELGEHRVVRVNRPIQLIAEGTGCDGANGDYRYRSCGGGLEQVIIRWLTSLAEDPHIAG
jgi:hypothetical protein